MSKPRFAIGIDPGSNTGWAIWDRTQRKFVFITTRSPASALIALVAYADPDYPSFGHVEVFCEDARKRKWIPKERGREVLQGVGSVKARCTDIEDACMLLKIPCTMLAPRKGMTKMGAAAFKKLTGWAERTSEHARDAAMLVFGR